MGAFADSDPSGIGFTVTGANIFTNDITIEKFLAVCLQENQRRMSKYDPQLLQPLFLPRLTKIVLRILQLVPKRKIQAVEGLSV